MAEIRIKALCVIRKSEKILVLSLTDSQNNSTVYKPLGGTVEFGEQTETALRREILEELKTEIHNVKHLGVLENIINFVGEVRHEIAFVYEVDLVNSHLYDLDTIEVEDAGLSFIAEWIPLNSFRAERLMLVPEGLLELIDDS